MKTEKQISFPAIKVNQWLKEWDKIPFNPKEHKAEPEKHFYVFSLPASYLKALSGIRRRSTTGGKLRSDDLGIQRRHDVSRSEEIHEFIHYGYPWSELSDVKRKSEEYKDLLKPGWLPTAIVVNILKPNDVRDEANVVQEDLLEITSKENSVVVNMPKSFTGKNWNPKELHPIEVIDGQHRLWAFKDDKDFDDYDLPVVAFHGLDVSWQAYLFWTINIKPKRINPSLAFDLYPLLRTEEWLDKSIGHPVYRETRAQELTEALWSHPDSPWYQRINMLGESGEKMVTQAAWIRSLTSTFIKSWEGPGVKIGGLFGAPVTGLTGVLPWTRAQQAAFVIFAGNSLKSALKNCDETWAKELIGRDRLFKPEPYEVFYNKQSLINTDQGIRGFLFIANDLCWVKANELKLKSWKSDEKAGATDDKAVKVALNSLKEEPVAEFIQKIASHLKHYDWRTSSASGLSDDDRLKKAAFRGGGGYKELRIQLLKHLALNNDDVGVAAKTVIRLLGV